MLPTEKELDAICNELAGHIQELCKNVSGKLLESPKYSEGLVMAISSRAAMSVAVQLYMSFQLTLNQKKPDFDRGNFFPQFLKLIGDDYNQILKNVAGSYNQAIDDAIKVKASVEQGKACTDTSVSYVAKLRSVPTPGNNTIN